MSAFVLTACKKDDDKKVPETGVITAAVSIDMPSSGGIFGYSSELAEKAKVELIKGGNVVATAYCEAKENVGFSAQSYGDYSIRVTGVRRITYSSGKKEDEDLETTVVSFTLGEANKIVSVNVQ